MADPVTDSRFPGFNPEVEESKAAEAEKAEADAAKARGLAAAPPPAPQHTHRCSMCGARFTERATPCPNCGAGYEPEALLPPEQK